MKINAIIFGASGMVGEGVLHTALQHPDVESVLVIGRRSCGVRDRKLKEILHADFFNYAAMERDLRGYNACYFCLGVSSIGKSEDEYRHITYDLTLAAAKTLSALNSDMTFCYVSGAGTDSTEKGRSMWARVKGKTENDLQTLPFKAVFLFRPGFIKPIPGLQHAYPFAGLIGLGYPLFKIIIPKFVCTLDDLGLAMIAVTHRGYPTPVIECIDITRLGSSHP